MPQALTALLFCDLVCFKVDVNGVSQYASFFLGSACLWFESLGHRVCCMDVPHLVSTLPVDGCLRCFKTCISLVHSAELRSVFSLLCHMFSVKCQFTSFPLYFIWVLVLLLIYTSSLYILVEVLCQMYILQMFPLNLLGLSFFITVLFIFRYWEWNPG
jgi:hypothetical protein